MLGSTLTLLLGFAFLAAVRVSGSPEAFGLAVLAGILLVGAACAMHLAATIAFVLATVPAPWRLGGQGLAWVAVTAGTIWLVGRAPGDEVVLALLAAPPLVGLAGLTAARESRWEAVGFLVVAGLLALLMGPIWLERRFGT